MKPGRKVKAKTIEDILERTRVEGDCRIWTGAKHIQGYGMTRHNGKMRTVHSVVAELKYGWVPDKWCGKRVTRTCDNIDCVNPDHIVIERADQIPRGGSRGGQFTHDQIREIRKKYDADPYYGILMDLSKEYNCGYSCMASICKRRIYKGVK